MRKYLIVNGITTVILYAAVAAWMPSVSGLPGSLRKSFDVFAMDHAVLGPILHRLVIVSGRN